MAPPATAHGVPPTRDTASSKSFASMREKPTNGAGVRPKASVRVSTGPSHAVTMVGGPTTATVAPRLRRTSS